MLKWCGHWFASLTLWLSGWFPMLRAPRNCQEVVKTRKSVLQCETASCHDEKYKHSK